MLLKKWQNWVLLITFILIATIILLVGSYSTSPFLPIKDTGDSCVFQTVGKWWAQGVVPYSGLWDLKGPYVYFFNAVGFLITKSNTGLFILQIINLIICEIIIYKLFRLNFKPIPSFILVFLTLLFIFFFLNAGNSVEEYCLPFLFSSVYLQYKYLNNINSHNSHKCSFTIMYGMTFAICILTRITNFIGIGIGILVICIYLIYKKEYLNLFKNALIFILSFCIVCLPFCIYFVLNNSFYDFLYGTFIYNFGYVNASTFTFRPTSLAELPTYIAGYGTAIICIVKFIILKNKKERIRSVFWIFVTLISYIWLLKCRDFRHYSMILVPYFCVAILEFNTIYRKTHKTKVKYLPIVMFIIFIFVSMMGVPKTIFNCVNYNKSNVNHSVTSENKQALDLIQNIPDNEKDSFIAYNCNDGLYLQANICPCYRFFTQQSFEIEQNSTLQPKVQEQLQSLKAKWILLRGKGDNTVNSTINAHYSLYKTSEVGDYALYRITS